MLSTAQVRCVKSSRWLASAIVLSMVLAMLAGCHRMPAEQQIRQTIDAAAKAARSNDVHGVLAAVAKDFTGHDGAFDRKGLHRLLALRALRQDRTGVLIGPVSFEHKGGRIIARFNLVLTGGKPDDLLPSGNAIFAMTTAWRRESGHWVCYNAEWASKGAS
ncbi:MAG TPA: hypothetical protein VFW60_08080 [Rhodanobacteraceae bacterium]|nr:hypothetical protein [Rhodanobacteraceae bacterium]